MASNEREFQPTTDAALQAPAAAAPTLSLPAAPETAEALLNAIGYEAADPALHAPQWAEAVGAGSARRSLR